MRKFIVGVFALIASTFAGTWTFSLLEKPVDVFISPDGKNKAELFGNKNRPWFFRNTVTAKIYSDNKLLALEGIHYGDSSDVSFESAYKFIDWQNNNVLRFGYEENNPQKDIDKLTIFNKSPKNLQYMLIRFFRDKYLIFDLKAGESQVLTKKRSAEIADYYVLGKLENGEKIESSVSLTYSNKSTADNPFQFCVSVEEGKNNLVNNAVRITDCSL